jgi:hypothetical protein
MNTQILVGTIHIEAAIIAAFLLIFLLIAKCSNWHENSPNEEQIVKVDTLIIRDTIVAIKPIFKEKKITDTILVSVEKSDTIHIRDTLFIRLQKEQKHFQDEQYSAWISGYKTSLDSIKIFRKTIQTTKYIEVPKKIHPKMSIGLQTGYGISFTNGQASISPFIGLGIQYDIISF